MKFVKIAIMMAVSLTMCFGFNAVSYAEQSLDIASVYKPPLSTPDGTGMADMIVKEAFSRIGIKANIIAADSAHALEKLDKGMYDGDLFRIAGANEKYPNIVQVTESFYDFDFMAFSKTVNVPMTGYDGLKPYRVATPAGWLETNANITEANTKSLAKITGTFDLFNALVKGDADIAVYERLMGNQIIKDNNMGNIRAIEPPLASKAMFLCLNVKHKDLIPKLTEVFKEMKKDGTIKKIMDQALGKFGK